MGIKAGTKLGLFRAPSHFEELLGALPDDVETTTRARAPLDVAILFVTQ